eukprot:scaffold254559_cov32-Tisochrysis_lutea.AAC.3
MDLDGPGPWRACCKAAFAASAHSALQLDSPANSIHAGCQPFARQVHRGRLASRAGAAMHWGQPQCVACHTRVEHVPQFQMGDVRSERLDTRNVDSRGEPCTVLGSPMPKRYYTAACRSLPLLKSSPRVCDLPPPHMRPIGGVCRCTTQYGDRAPSIPAVVRGRTLQFSFRR